jgi:hypothetical protein
VKKIIQFIKDEWGRIINSPLRQLIYLMVMAVILGRLAMHYDTTFLRILALIPFIFLAGIILVFLVYAWIINPWRKQKRK